MTTLPPARRMTSWAARSLLEEIAALREDIHEQGMQHRQQLRNLELMVQAIYCDLHTINQARLPQE